MTKTKRRNALVALTLVLGMSVPGCTDGLVADTARASLTSFLTTLASTAISNAVSPS